MTKNLLNKLSVDEYNHEYLMKHYQEGGRFKLFSNVFFGKMSNMSKANWWMILFALPALAALVYAAYKAYDCSVYTPFSANFGLGYPVVSDNEEVYSQLIFNNNMFRALLMIPCIIIGFIGLAGVFNVIKYESLGFSVKVTKEFFKGIKNNFVTYMWLGLIIGALYFSFDLSLNFYGNPDLALGIKIATIAINALIFAFALIMAFYVMTQSALYNLPLSKMIKNAFWLTVSFVIQNVLILICSAVPVGLIFLMSTSTLMQLIIIVVLAIMGFSYIVCVWTIYSHYVYGMIFTAVVEQNHAGKNKKHKKSKSK